MPKDLECRLFRPEQLRLQEATETDKALITGHAAVFNQLSEDLGGFRERIAPGAFGNSIKQGDIRALLNHNSDMVLGRSKAGTLRLQEDETGLAIEIDPPATTYASDLMVSMKRSDIDQMSFGFYTINDSWDKVDGEWIRTLLEVELLEVSPVTFPAYPQTTVSARSMDAWKQAQAADVPPVVVDPDEIRKLRLRIALAA